MGLNFDFRFYEKGAIFIILFVFAIIIALLSAVIGLIQAIVLLILSLINAIGMVLVFLLDYFTGIGLDTGQFWAFSLFFSILLFVILRFVFLKNVYDSKVIMNRVVPMKIYIPIILNLIVWISFLSIFLFLEFGFKLPIMTAFKNAYLGA